MLKSLMRKLAAVKDKVQKGSKFDKRNLADNTRERSPLAKQVVDRNARNMFEKVMRTDIAMQPEDYDTNQQSSLAFQEFVFTSVAKAPAANLISLEIIAGLAESIEVIDNHIKITINDTVSDHDSVKALIDGYAPAAALISAEINAGQGAVVVTAEATKYFSGAIA